jgi:hypothetical protein
VSDVTEMSHRGHDRGTPAGHPIVVRTLLALLALAACSPAAPARGPGGSLIVLVVVDGLTGDALTAGDPELRAGLRRLVDEGVVYPAATPAAIRLDSLPAAGRTAVVDGLARAVGAIDRDGLGLGEESDLLVLTVRSADLGALDVELGPLLAAVDTRLGRAGASVVLVGRAEDEAVPVIVRAPRVAPRRHPGPASATLVPATLAVLLGQPIASRPLPGFAPAAEPIVALH